jgi:hypothetical protein
MRRTRHQITNTQTWYPATQNIDKMERAMVNVMTKLQGVTPADVIDWVVPAEELALLRAATPHAEVNSSSYSSDQMRNINFPFGKVTLYLDFVHMGVIPPKKNLITIQPDAPKAGQLRTCMETVMGIVTQFNKLRHILGRFKALNVTPGAAKYYFPTLQCLLPRDHAFFSVTGTRFRQVHFEYETMEYMREAPEILAKGLLVDPNVNGKDKPGRSLFRVDCGNSQVFVLLSKGE